MTDVWNNTLVAPEIRVCTCCGEERDYYPAEEKHSKASNFHMGTCWTCYLERSRGGNKEPLKRGRPRGAIGEKQRLVNARFEAQSTKWEAHLAQKREALESEIKALRAREKYREEDIVAYYEKQLAYIQKLGITLPKL